jgi:hypothetical protein
MNSDLGLKAQTIRIARAGVTSALALLSFTVAPRLLGQTAPAPAAAPGTSAETTEEVVKLSPFVVETTEGTGYRAESTLAGTRVRTDLKDVASSISVVTADFLRDIGATNNQTLLQYTTNTEVGGIYGNYGGIGSTYINGASESSNFLKPNQNTRVRGLDSADNTRDYFLTDIPWDAYNVGRVDLQRGPNSILFGIGSPAGIVNTSVNAAEYKNQGKFENRVGSFGTLRNVLDINRVILQDELAVRVSALDDDTKYRQKPAYNHDRRIFGALRWDPKVFERWDSTAHTTVRANFENGDVKANRPRVLPPEDRISPFFYNSAGGINKTAYDPYYVWAAGLIGYQSANSDGGQSHLSKQFWTVQYPGPGIQMTNNPVFFYDSATTGTPTSAREGLTAGYWGISSTGTRDGQISGIPYGSPVGIAGYSEFATNVNNTYSSQFPGASSGFYKNRSMTDTSIFDFYNHLIDGPNKKEWNGWNAFNVAVDQTFLNNRIGVQLVYDRQRYHDGQERNLNNPYITVDIDANTMLNPWSFTPNQVITFNGSSYLQSNGAIEPATAYSSVNYTRTSDNPTPGTNPNAGRAFVGSGLNNGGNSSNTTDRENIRATVTGELRFDDFMRKSTLTDILGRHVFTGLYSHETYDQDHREWVRYGVTGAWSDAVGTGGGGQEGYGTGTGGLIGGDRVLDWVTYLSAPLWDKTSSSGLHLPAIDTVQSPSGTATIQYFDSHWKWPTNPVDPSYVNPGAAWANPTVVNPGNSTASTQSENPANYVGWRTGNFPILNADQGDLDSLYTGGAKIRKVTESQAGTWQAYFWDDTLVGTFGWRHDKQQQVAGTPTIGTNGAAGMNYDLNYGSQATSTGNSVSWGVVLHTPKFLREKLPLGTDIALTYSYGKNMRVENRYGFAGETLPNAKGMTRDYGVVISTLNDRVQLKATIYDTKVYDANLSSVTTEVSTLGSNTYYLYLLEAWGTASAMSDLAGMAGEPTYGGWDWYWDFANIDAGWPGGDLLNPNSAAFKSNASTVLEKAAVASWQAQMQPQSWYNAYGLHVDVAKVKAGDYMHALNNGAWTPSSGIGALQADGKGRINGSYPTGTVDNESKGVEFELYAQPTKNWNITANASKQKAEEVSLGAPLVSFIEAQHTKFMSPAGDLRLWWGGDNNLRTYYNNNIWAPYVFQKASAGRMVPEMSPWRANVITNYSFDHGIAKGVNVGLACRWEQGKILGYGLNTTGDNLDVNKAYWGKAEYWVDLWAGYSRKLSSKVDWRIQLNLRNVNSRPHLSTLTVQPNGDPAQFRIEEGQTWELTNTFTF